MIQTGQHIKASDITELVGNIGGVTPVTDLLFTTPTFSINSSGELIATYSS